MWSYWVGDVCPGQVGITGVKVTRLTPPVYMYRGGGGVSPTSSRGKNTMNKQGPL